jgi:catechol 2,3-dioxygenase-like lactoylglutathione lyase family enzyme
VSTTPVIVCLPTADRRISFTFYRDGLGFEPVGELADDGVPEPLQFIFERRCPDDVHPNGWLWVGHGRSRRRSGRVE